jgi:tRNA nucleotidyltransferase (CCA-adding enzyme)
MKISKIKDGIVISVNDAEALKIVASLTSQIAAGNSNSGRAEMLDDKGKYFTIAVVPDEVEKSTLNRRYGSPVVLTKKHEEFTEKERYLIAQGLYTEDEMREVIWQPSKGMS